MGREGTIGILIGVAVGAVVGAAVALLYAPMSGQDLQRKIRKEAQRGLDEAKAGYERALKDMSKAMDEGLSDVKAQVAKVSRKTA